MTLQSLLRLLAYSGGFHSLSSSFHPSTVDVSQGVSCNSHLFKSFTWSATLWSLNNFNNHSSQDYSLICISGLHHSTSSSPMYWTDHWTHPSCYLADTSNSTWLPWGHHLNREVSVYSSLNVTHPPICPLWQTWCTPCPYHPSWWISVTSCQAVSLISLGPSPPHTAVVLCLYYDITLPGPKWLPHWQKRQSLKMENCS